MFMQEEKAVTNSLTKMLFLAFSAVALFALPAAAQINSIDYVGYGWNTGALKTVGDEFHFVGAASALDDAFGVDLLTEELTFHVYGLIVTSEMDLGGTIMRTYSGGYMEIYEDPSMNADFGINPPNPTSPSTFNDGTLFFSGQFVDLTMVILPTGNGSFEGNLNGTGGTMIDGSCNGCVYTWGGTFLADSGAQIPEGYDMQVDGVLEIDAAVATDDASWDAVKALYSY